MIQLNCLSVDDNTYVPSRVLSTLTEEFTAATHVMQSSSNELSTLVSGEEKNVKNESYYIMHYNSRADMVRLLTEWYEPTQTSLYIYIYREREREINRSM